MTPEKLSSLITAHCPWASVLAFGDGALTILYDTKNRDLTHLEYLTLDGLLRKHNTSFGTWDKVGSTFVLRVTLAREESAT